MLRASLAGRRRKHRQRHELVLAAFRRGSQLRAAAIASRSKSGLKHFIFLRVPWVYPNHIGNRAATSKERRPRPEVLRRPWGGSAASYVARISEGDP